MVPPVYSMPCAKVTWSWILSVTWNGDGLVTMLSWVWDDWQRKLWDGSCMHAQLLSHVRLIVTLWAVTCQGPLSMGFFRQEYWSGLPFPPLGDLPDPGIEPAPLCLLHWRRTLYPLSHQESTTLIHRPKYLIILFFLTPACSHPTLEEYDFHRISATTS